MLDLCLLGTGGTMPSINRHLASCMMRLNGKCLLIDCGEGTQIAVKENSFTFKPIDILCVTHFHADHISGLPGLLLSMGNEGREEPLTIIGPAGLERVVGALRVIAPELPFSINCIEVRSHEERFSLCGYEICAFSLSHTMPCLGYSIEVKRAGLFDVEKAKANNVPLKVWSRLQKEGFAEYEGVSYTGDMVLGPERKGIKVCYCTDSRPLPKISEYAKGADLFICEGMYPDEEKEEKAYETKHMTFVEAANLALSAKPDRFWLTHYSPSLPDPENYIDCARRVYPSAVLGKDGKKITLRFDDSI